MCRMLDDCNRCRFDTEQDSGATEILSQCPGYVNIPDSPVFVAHRKKGILALDGKARLINAGEGLRASRNHRRSKETGCIDAIC